MEDFKADGLTFFVTISVRPSDAGETFPAMQGHS